MVSSPSGVTVPILLIATAQNMGKKDYVVRDSNGR